MPRSSARSRARYGRALRGRACACAGVGRVERVADRADRGLGVARVVPPVRIVARRLGPRSRRQRHGHRRSERRRRVGMPPALETTVVHPVRRARRRSRTRASRRRSRSTSAGRGSYSCGSVFGCRIWCTCDRVAADRARPVADLRRRRDDVELASSSDRSCSPPAATSASGAEPGTRSARASPEAIARQKRRARRHAPREHRDRGPGRRVQLDREPEAGDALDRRERDRAELPASSRRRVHEAHGRRRHDEQRRREQRADRGERRDDRERDRARAARASGSCERRPSARARVGVEAGREPARPERERRGDGRQQAATAATPGRRCRSRAGCRRAATRCSRRSGRRRSRGSRRSASAPTSTSAVRLS